jgi:hypothetical protein
MRVRISLNVDTVTYYPSFRPRLQLASLPLQRSRKKRPLALGLPEMLTAIVRYIKLSKSVPQSRSLLAEYAEPRGSSKQWPPATYKPFTIAARSYGFFTLLVHFRCAKMHVVSNRTLPQPLGRSRARWMPFIGSCTHRMQIFRAFFIHLKHRVALSYVFNGLRARRST